MNGKSYVGVARAVRRIGRLVALVVVTALLAPGMGAAQMLHEGIQEQDAYFARDAFSLDRGSSFPPGGLSISFQLPLDKKWQPIRPRQVVEQLLFGTAFGAAAGIIGFVVGLGIDSHYHHQFIYTGRLAAAGWIAGSAVAVHLTGQDESERASFLATLGGSTLGALIAGMTAPPAFYAWPALGSTIGYQVTRYPVEVAEDADQVDGHE